MITIEFDGKTYKPKWQFYHVESILDWIAWGDLEEVKENEDSILEKLRAENPIITYIRSDKLREELERRIKVIEWIRSIWQWSYVSGRLFELNEVRDFLTSLETPPISKMETTQFTPWQEEQKTNMKVWEKTFEITIKSI